MKNGNEMPKPVLSLEDYSRLSGYLQRLAPGVTSRALEEEIDRADLRKAKELPESVVRLGSRVTYLDLQSGREREITIVPPERAAAGNGFVSFLAPVGAALLGLSAGQQIEWVMPNGKTRAFKVLTVGAQEEAMERSKTAA